MIYFAYATLGTPYMREAELLAESLGKLGLFLSLRAVPNLGSWQKNTQQKATIVREVLKVFPNERCVYIDADSLVLSRPSYLETVDADIAAVIFNSDELLSGVVMFNGARAMPTVERWVELCAMYPEQLPDGRDAWDQRLLQMAIADTASQVKFASLPPAYNCISELSEQVYPGIKPVILATRGASRFRQQIDSGMCA